MGVVDDAGGLTVVDDREAGGLDDELVRAAVGRRGDNAPGIDLADDGAATLERGVLGELGHVVLDLVDRVERGGHGVEPVSDRLVARPLPRRESEEVGIDEVEVCAAAAEAVEVAVRDAAELIVMLDHARLAIAFHVHGQALLIASGAVIRIAQPVGHGEHGSVFIDHAAVGPHVALVPVRESAFDPDHRDFDGLESGDELDQIDVVAADVDERVRAIAGEPVLEIGRAVEVGLNHLRLAHDEGAEVPEFIVASCDQGAAVESFMIFHADEQAFLEREFLDFNGLFVFQDQRLDAEDVLIGGQRVHDDGVVELVGHGHDHGLARRHGGEDVLVEFRVLVIGVLSDGRVRREVLAWKRLVKRRVLFECA